MSTCASALGPFSPVPSAAAAWILAGVLLITSCVSPAAAQDPQFTASTLWSSAHGVAVVEDVAVALFSLGMATFDVSNPEEPVLLERFMNYPSPPGFMAIEVVGDLAYVGSAVEGLQVYDLAVPSHPVLLGSYDVPGTPQNMVVSGGLLYIAAGYNGGVQIFDLSVPEKPQWLGGCAFSLSCYGLAVSGGYAYTADGMEGISIVDVSDPCNPFYVSTFFDMGYPPYAIAAQDGFLYSIGCYGSKSDWDPTGMSVHDLTDPLNPEYRGLYNSSEGANRLALRGGYAYLANADGSLTTVDITDPDDPFEVFETEIGGYCMGIRIVGDRAYVPSSGGTLAILDLSAPAAPALLGRWWEATVTNDVRVRDGYAFAADSKYGVHVVDLGDPWEPAVLAHLPLPGRPVALAASDDYIFVAADTSGVFALDTSDPGAPFIAGSLGQLAGDIECDGRYLYTVARDTGLRIIDARDPQYLRPAAVCPVPGWLSSVSVAKAFACVSNGSALYVVDLADPEHPLIRGSYDPDEYIRHVTFDGTWAYLCAGNNGLLVVDVSDPDAPVFEAELRFDGNTRGSWLEGNRLYLSTTGLQVIDVSDPRNPKVVGSHPMGSSIKVAVDGSLACTAAGSCLGVFLAGPAAGTESGQPGPASSLVRLVCPNPVRGQAELTLESGRSVSGRLVLADVLGRSVRTVCRRTFPEGRSSLRLDTAGLASGVYYLRFTGAGVQAVEPVVVLR